MISEERIRKAVMELEEPAAQEHSFSPEFEEKILGIMQPSRKNNRRFALRWIAAAAAALVLVLGSVVAISPEARASVVGWLRQHTPWFSQYSYTGTAQPESPKRYALDWVPAGYTLFYQQQWTGGADFVYTNAEGKFLVFSYLNGPKEGQLSIYTENHQLQTHPIGDSEADLYVSQAAGASNSIVWKRAEVLLHISAPVDRETLIKLAESVMQKEEIP